MYLLPSLFTAGGLGAGYFSITQTLDAISHDAQTHLDWAAIAILFAIPFDALDGRIARMTNTTSEFGKELDSLADVITFGVAPSLLAFVWGFHFLPDSLNAQVHQHLIQAGAFVSFLFLLSGASRLARFNISNDAQPRNPGRPGRKYFVGMPIPAAAGLLAATVHFFNAYPVEEWWVALPWLLLVGLCGFLMVSTWRFWSAKEINFSRRHPFSCSYFWRWLLTSLSGFPMRCSSWPRWSICFPASGPAPSTAGNGADAEGLQARLLQARRSQSRIRSDLDSLNRFSE
jgi:CDP-diacylglycerol--serine O-phosphatidyltransferase